MFLFFRKYLLVILFFELFSLVISFILVLVKLVLYSGINCSFVCIYVFENCFNFKIFIRFLEIFEFNFICIWERF